MKNGGSIDALPEDAVYTPSARDMIRDAAGHSSAASGNSAAVSSVSDGRPARDKNIPPPSVSASQQEIESYFNSPGIQELKEQICDIGRRLWEREYVDGNGGNISIRLSDELVLCTPTLISKGFMKPVDMCLVDMNGNQKAGGRKSTSEILMHLAIMKSQPKAKACVHCHPPYATAFAVAGVTPPTCMIPEIEVFIGEVPIAPYHTPGTPELGRKIAEMADKHNTILMANHGVVSWSHSVEDAYFKMEILEAYCRTVVVASQLGAGLKTFSPSQLNELLDLKRKMDIPDSRYGLKECELCDNSEWRPGAACAVSQKETEDASRNPEAEALVQNITDAIIAKMQG